MSITSTPTETNPLWLRAVASLGAVWYAFGFMQFVMAVTTDPAAAAAGQITQAHAAAIASTPALIWVAFAIASGAGLVGAVMLFMRHPATAIVFAVSLASAAIYYLWVYGLSGTGGDRPGEELIISGVVVAITTGFLLLSKKTT